MSINWRCWLALSWFRRWRGIQGMCWTCPSIRMNRLTVFANRYCAGILDVWMLLYVDARPQVQARHLWLNYLSFWLAIGFNWIKLPIGRRNQKKAFETTFLLSEGTMVDFEKMSTECCLNDFNFLGVVRWNGRLWQSGCELICSFFKN